MQMVHLIPSCRAYEGPLNLARICVFLIVTYTLQEFTCSSKSTFLCLMMNCCKTYPEDLFLEQAWAKNVTAAKLSKSDKLGQVDHSTINYPVFRRNFYIEAQEIQMMTEKQVADYRLQLDDIKVRGKDVPRPVKNWAQCGMSGRIMDTLKKSGFTNPMPIQVISSYTLQTLTYILAMKNVFPPTLDTAIICPDGLTESKLTANKKPFI